MSEPYRIQTFDTKPEWLTGVHPSIGASTSAGIIGVSSYRSAYSEWFHLTEPPRTGDDGDEMQRWGLILEPVIFDELNRIFKGRPEFAMLKRYTVYWDRQRPYLHATIDGMTDNGEPVEVKTAHFASAKVWQKEVPLPYMVQVQHQLYITGAKLGYIAVLADGYQFAWHRVQRHQKFIDRLLAKLDHFWNEHVVKRVPPPTDYHAATTAALARQFPNANGKCIELPAELEPLVEEYDQLTDSESKAKRRKDEIKNLLKSKMGDNQYGTFLSGSGFSWSGKDERRTFRRKTKCPEPESISAA